MALPEPSWFAPVWQVGGAVFAGLGAWKFAVSKRAVSDDKVTATIATVNKHEERLRTLEDGQRDVNADVKTIDKRTQRTDEKVDRIGDTTNQILGELRARNDHGGR